MISIGIEKTQVESPRSKTHGPLSAFHFNCCITLPKIQNTSYKRKVALKLWVDISSSILDDDLIVNDEPQETYKVRESSRVHFKHME